jgi:glutamate carboxypeptidase
VAPVVGAGAERMNTWRRAAWAACLSLGVAAAQAQVPDMATLQARAAQQVPAVLETMKQLVAIESGSRDLEGLAEAARVVAARLEAAGMAVQVIPTQAPAFNPQLKGAPLGPMVLGTKAGTGSRKVLLIAHLDTVYARGMVAKQPFRIDGDRAWGLGISDDKGGVALILHVVELLEQLGLHDYAQLGVLINADEEIGSPGSAPTLIRLGGEYDAVLSFEGGGVDQDMLRLATSAIATAELKVTGRAAHAGAFPEGGRNALYELAHQVLKSRHLGDPARGLKINWTVAHAGEVRNVIPASASAVADIRALDSADLDGLEAALRESIKERLIPDTVVELEFRRGRPAFTANAASRVLAQHAQAVFKEMGLTLGIRDRATGGGTDAAYAGLRPKGAVLESFGPRGFGAHSNEREYVVISSIAPRLALATRLVLDIGSGAVRW